jgi:hypothetical protein
MIDSSRGDLRFIRGQPFSTRYRNKLQLERDFSFGSLAFTPYLNGQLYYDTRYDVWNRNRYSAGVEVPAGKHLVLETYYLRQNDSPAPVFTRERGRPYLPPLFLIDLDYTKPAAPATRVF